MIWIIAEGVLSKKAVKKMLHEAFVSPAPTIDFQVVWFILLVVNFMVPINFAKVV